MRKIIALALLGFAFFSLSAQAQVRTASVTVATAPAAVTVDPSATGPENYAVLEARCRAFTGAVKDACIGQVATVKAFWTSAIVNRTLSARAAQVGNDDDAREFGAHALTYTRDAREAEAELARLFKSKG